MKALRTFAGGLLFLIGALASTWAAAALFFDFPISALRIPAAIAFFAAVAILLIRTRVSRRGVLVWIASLMAVLVWWLTLRPTNDRDWQRDVDRMAWAEVAGDQATIHKIRNFDYLTEEDFASRWETKTVDIATIRGIDLFISHWGSPWIAHAVVSFSFADGTDLATSIEARKAVGQDYSAVRGFFRQYEILYLMAEERDVVGVRTRYRKESVSLYHTLTKPQDARNLFRQYLLWMNQARSQPEWYNALTRNCVSNYVGYLASAKVGGVSRGDWRTLLEGRADEMLYQLGDLGGGLPFPELKQRALISAAQPTAVSSREFSLAIRKGRPGF